MKQITIISLMLLAFNVNAQQFHEVTRHMPGEHLVGAYFEFGTSVITSGIFYKYGIEAFHKNISLGTDIAFPLFNPDMNDLRIKIITIDAELIHIDYFNLNINYAPTLSRFKSYTQQMKAWGNEFGLITGFYGKNWGIGTEIKFDKMYATHIHHTVNYQRFFDDNSHAKDGWYRNSASNVRLGLHIAKRLDNLDLETSFGVRRKSNFEKYIIAPSGYAEISAHYRL